MVDAVNILKPSGCFEIQKIIGMSAINGNFRSYQVQWAPSWISGAHLMGCENLIEQFECSQKQKDEADSNIETPDENKQKEAVNNPEIGEETDYHSLPDNCGLTDLESNSNNEGIALSDCNMYEDSAIHHEISKGLQDVSKDIANSANNVNHQSNLEKVASLDFIIRQIYTRNDRSIPHPDFQQMKVDADNARKMNKKDEQEEVSRNVEFIVISEEQKKIPLLQDVDNLCGAKRKVAVPNKSYRRRKVQKTKSNISDNINLRKDRVKNIVERKNEATKISQYEVCRDDVSLKKNAKLHKSVHQCIVCYRTFKLKESLHKHNAKLHGECNICNKKFSNFHKLQVHIETHKSVKEDPLECSYCDRTVVSKSALVAHERVHTGERPFKCTMCHCAFKQAAALRCHLETHGNIHT